MIIVRGDGQKGRREARVAVSLDSRILFGFKVGGSEKARVWGRVLGT